mgnify:CR=1 FL=1
MKNITLASSANFPPWAIVLILLAFFGLIVLAVILVKRKVKPLQIKKDDMSEEELMKVILKEHWSRLNPQLMTLGREICKARCKDCENCFLTKECEFYKKSNPLLRILRKKYIIKLFTPFNNACCD